MSCVCVSGFLLVLLLGVLVHFFLKNEEKKIERPDFVMGFCADKLIIHGDCGIWKQVFIVSARVLLKY